MVFAVGNGRPCKVFCSFALYESITFQGYGGMSGHILAMYVVYLLRKRKLNQLMNAFMTFRTVVTQLCESFLRFSNGAKV